MGKRVFLEGERHVRMNPAHFRTAETDVVWMTVTPEAGTTSGNTNTHALVFNTGGLAKGAHTGTVAFASDSADNTPLDLTVVLRVRGPALTVTPAEFSVVVEEGDNAPTGEISIRNSGLGVLLYSVTSDVAWAHCTVTSGTSTGETDRITLEFASAALPQGQVSGAITIDGGDADGSPFRIPVTLTVLPPFAVAVECESLTITNDSARPWGTDTSTTHDGVDAGRSAAVSDNESSAFGVSVTGPGILSFWWRTSSEQEYDVLQCLLDGTPRHVLSGMTGWENVSLAVPVGNHTATWVYAKDQSLSAGSDCGWVDEVGWQPLTSPCLSPAESPIRLSAAAGSVPTGYVDIANLGPGTAAFATAVEPDWLVVSPTGGVVAGTPVRLDLTAPDLVSSQGVHNATLTLTSAHATNSPLAIPVEVLLSSPLDEALDFEDIPAVDGGDQPWFGQSAVTRDGEDAAQSGAITNNQRSVFSMTSTVASVVEFWWRVSSESGYDYLVFRVDGNDVDAISGNTDWTRISHAVPSGSHELSWSYEKDGSASVGHDCGWVDQLAVTEIVGGYLTTSSERLGFLYASSGSPVAPQTLRVQNVVTSTCTFAVMAATNWLTSSPTSGSSTGNVIVLTVSCDAAGLAPGVYENKLTITSRQADNSPLQLPVSLEVAPSLSDALDQPAWTFSSGGDKPWRGGMADRRDASGYGQSGEITHEQTSEMSCTLHGPGDLAFWWQVSSETRCDFLLFRVDGTNALSISGETDWAHVVHEIPAGTHTVSWVYTKDDSVSAGQDRGRVDAITWDTGDEPLHSPRVTAFRNTPAGHEFACASSNSVPLVFRLQYRGGLSSGVWQDLPDGVRTVSTGHATFDIPFVGATQRFFRVTSRLAP